MTLEALGYNSEWEQLRQQHNLQLFDVGRVIAEHRERYSVRTAEKEYDAEITGNLQFTANRRSDFPAVGDWVAIAEYDVDKGLIYAVFPRKTVIERQAVGKHGESQIIAANIDVAFIVQAVDRDFNINRLERYLTICYTAKVTPVILLNKTDLVEDSILSTLVAGVRKRIKEVPVLTVSSKTHQGMDILKKRIEKGMTCCMLGSSGVGKSSLLNNLAGRTIMRTGTISRQSDRGKHITSHRALFVLENGGIIIDNPGMREVGITDATGGLETTFREIIKLYGKCKFADCTHTTEAGCAVLEAVSKGQIEKDTYENYLKMEREKEHFESTVAERRKKDKAFGKMIKNYIKDMNRNRY